MNNISRISLAELHDFIECPRRLILNYIPALEDITTMALRTMMHSYHLSRISNVIVNPSDLKRMFSASYVAYEARDHSTRRHKGISPEKRKELAYTVSEVSNSFARIFGLYDDSLAGHPVGSQVKFNVKCPCGNHHLYGNYDLVWSSDNKTYGIIYDFNKKPGTAKHWKFSNMPGLWKYILDQTLGVKANTKVCIYYPWVGKLKVLHVNKDAIEDASKLICISSYCKASKIAWRIEDQILCKVCRYKSICNT